MPRLPRAQQETIYKPAQMPNLAGSGWTAPGRATQQLGQAIGQLGNAFDALAAKQEEEDLFKTRLELVNFTNKMEADNIDAEKGFTPDMDASTWSANRTTHYRDSASDLISRLPQTPKSQRMARLYIAQHGGAYQRRAMSFESTQRTANLINTSEATITGDLSRVDLSDPKTAITNLETSLQGAEGIINSIPGASPAQRRYLMNHAASLAQSKIEALPDAVRAPAAQTLIDTWRDKLAVKDAVPQLSGPVTMAEPPLKRTVGAPRRSKVAGIVFHQTWGSDTMEGNGSWSNKTGTGANYYIAKDGKVYQWAPDDVRMGHAGKGRGGKDDIRPDLSNDNTIGIEIMTRPNERPNPTQIAVAKSLGTMLMQKYGLSTKDVVGHGEIAPGHRMKTEAIEAVNAIRGEGGTAVAAAKSSGPRSIVQHAGLAPDTPSTDHELGPDPEIGQPRMSGSSGDEGGEARRPVQLQSGARAQLLENLTKRMPQYRAQQLAAVDKMVKRAESVAVDGKELPDAEMATIAEAVNATGSPVLAYRLKLAGYEAEVVRERKMDSPAVAAARAQAERAAIEASGKTTPENLARVKAQETLANTIAENVKKDAIGWAVKVGKIGAQQPLDPNAMDLPTFERALGERLSVARGLSADWKTPLQVFSAGEKEALGKFLEQGGKPTLGVLRAIYDQAGGDTRTVIAELSKYNREAAHLAWLVASKAPSKTVNDVAEGMALLRNPDFKKLTITETDRRQWTKDVMGDALTQEQKDAQASAMHLADILYQKRAFDQGITDGSRAPLWKDALKEAVGENKAETGGKVYGGVHYWNGGQFILPPTVEQGRIADIMNGIRREDLIKQPPVDAITGDSIPIGAPPEGGRSLMDATGLSSITNAIGLTSPGETPVPLGPRVLPEDPARSPPPVAPGITQTAQAISKLINVPPGQGPDQVNFGLPVDEAGNPVTMQMIRSAKLITVNDGKYWLKTEDFPARYIKNQDGTNYVLDLGALEPVLRQRPTTRDAFRPGGETDQPPDRTPINIESELYKAGLPAPVPTTIPQVEAPKPAAPMRLPGSQWTVPEPEPAPRPKAPPTANPGPSNRLPAAP